MMFQDISTYTSIYHSVSFFFLGDLKFLYRYNHIDIYIYIIKEYKRWKGMTKFRFDANYTEVS